MHKSTLAVHSGTRRDPQGGLNTPVYADSAYPYLDHDQVRYPRYFNTPNQQAVVDKLAALEHAEDGVLCASGLAAISTALQAHLNNGDQLVVASGIYGGSDDMCRQQLPRLGIEVSYAQPDAEALLAACGNNAKVIFCETPCNPRLQVIDLEYLCSQASARGILVVIDNTFATPVLQNPLRLGADLVVHSATKYIGGHSDICAGVVLGSKQLIAPIRELGLRLGGSMNAQTAALLERSIKTLAIRVERQCQNAIAVARALEQHPDVECVDYPGLTSHPQHQLAKTQMADFGGMLSFRVKPPLTAELVERKLRLISSAVSLGGVETTCCQPILTSHARVPAEDSASQGVDQQLLRISTGIEQAEDLIADLHQALQQARQA